jgi:thymidylate synthase ThyX
MNYSKPEAKVIADSISPAGVRLTTIQARIHRFVLAELNTHRVFSRNSASSRAIPMKKLRQSVIDDPALPVWWGKNQAGMQAETELVGAERDRAERLWLDVRDETVKNHEDLEAAGLHKQLANRILEPFLWHHVIISATEWDNFEKQRVHKDAQPEMRAAATAIIEARKASIPKQIPYGGWHLPYTEGIVGSLDELKAISVGRCARVSYLNHEGQIDIDADVKLFDRLTHQFPGHWSPLEHVATPMEPYSNVQRGNFIGWRQLRHEYEPV